MASPLTTEMEAFRILDPTKNILDAKDKQVLVNLITESGQPVFDVYAIGYLFERLKLKNSILLYKKRFASGSVKEIETSGLLTNFNGDDNENTAKRFDTLKRNYIDAVYKYRDSWKTTHAAYQEADNLIKQWNTTEMSNADFNDAYDLLRTKYVKTKKMYDDRIAEFIVNEKGTKAEFEEIKATEPVLEVALHKIIVVHTAPLRAYLDLIEDEKLSNLLRNFYDSDIPVVNIEAKLRPYRLRVMLVAFIHRLPRLSDERERAKYLLHMVSMQPDKEALVSAKFRSLCVDYRRKKYTF